jgi:CHAT domain-containing protein
VSAPHSRLFAFALLCCPLIGAATGVPATCSERPSVVDDTTPIPQLRARILTLGDTDPLAALDLLCGNLPRVEREQGENSLELALWRQAMATPLIAYLNRFGEAEALLAEARPILERKLGASSPELAELQVAYAWMAFRRGQLEEAGNAWAKALAIRERHPGERKVELQKVLVGLAQVRMSQRRFAEAKQLADRGLAILAKNGETISEAAAAIKNLLANAALREENFAVARGYAEEQIAIELKLHEQGGPDQPVTAYAMLGQILQRLDEYAEAEQALREAVRLAESREGPLQRNAFTALLQLSVLLNERGNPREAAEFASKALALGERELGKDAPNLIPVLANLAEANRALGDLSLALRYFERGAQIAAAHPDDPQRQILLRLRRGYGVLLLELGDKAGAERELRAADEIGRADPTLSTDRASALVVRANLQRQSGASGAGELLQSALSLYEARLPKEHPLISRVVNELCGLAIDSTGGNAEVCDDARERLLRARYADPSLRQAVLQNQSELAKLRGDAARMQSYALESLAAALTLGTPDPLWKAQFQLARALRERHQNALAIFFGKESIDQIQQLRRSLVGADARLDPLFIRDKVAVYRELADWLMEAGRMDEALEVLDLLKGEELSEFLVRAGSETTRRPRISRSPAEAQIGSRYQGLIESDAAGGADIDELSRLEQTGRITPSERTRLGQLLASQPKAEAMRVARLGEFLSMGASEAGVPALRARTVQAMRLDREIRRLGGDAVLAVYLLTEHRLRILVASRLHQTEYQTEIDAAALRRDIGRLLDDIANRRDVTSQSRALFDQLLRPVDAMARAAGATRLILWPDGALRYVPFAALSDGSANALERYAIQLYSGASQRPAVVGHRVAAPSVRGLGVTKAMSGYSALPSMADELCSIVRGPITGLDPPGARCLRARTGSVTGEGALRGEGYADAAFTEQRLAAQPGQPRDFSVLHVGTHFALRPGNAVRSFLLLGDGTQLTLDRLAAIDFTGVELMTLSACQTALGGAVTDDGREIEGLASLVQSAGVSRVIASLWRVEDRSTALLMAEFYRRLADGRTVKPEQSASALRLAQLEIGNRVVNGRRPYAHPYYWAGFTLAAK